VWWHCNRAGLVLKEFGAGACGNSNTGPRGDADYAVAFSMATPLPSALLRSLALYGGCTPWSSLGDLVAANGSMVAVHKMTSGPSVLRFPHAARAPDALSGALAAKSADRFEAHLEAPALPACGFWTSRLHDSCRV